MSVCACVCVCVCVRVCACVCLCAHVCVVRVNGGAVIKYQPLLNIISEIGYWGLLLVFIFASLGHTHGACKRASTTWDAKIEGYG